MNAKYFSVFLFFLLIPVFATWARNPTYKIFLGLISEIKTGKLQLILKEKYTLPTTRVGSLQRGSVGSLPHEDNSIVKPVKSIDERIYSGGYMDLGIGKKHLQEVELLLFGGFVRYFYP